MFHYAVQPEVFLDAANLRALVAELETELGPEAAGPAEAGLDAGLQVIDKASRRATEAWQRLAACATAPSSALALQRLIVAQSAPMAAALGAWLQGLSAPAVFDDEVHLELLALLADDVGAGRCESARHDAHRLLARELGVTETVGASRDLTAVRSLHDSVFGWPAVLLGLSRRSDAFDCELVGIDLALRTVGLLPPWRTLAEALGATRLAGLDLRVAQTTALPNGRDPLQISRRVALRLCTSAERSVRVCAGITWATNGLLHWNRSLGRLARAHGSPRTAMALLVQARAREASVYHQSYKLEGKPLSEWFHAAKLNPMPLVAALERSKLVRPKDPAKSALISSLIAPDGPMFRIFSDADVAVIRSWIEMIAQPEHAGDEDGATLPVEDDLGAPPPRSGDSSLGATPSSIREAYFLLQGRALPPRTRAFAHAYVTRWLAIARDSIDKTSRSLPTTWRSGLLRTWLLDAHEAHSNQFEASKDESVPSRQDIIDQTLQLAPLTLIDGAWLQGFTDVAIAGSRWGARLFQTYWDELGNGHRVLNHPKIYRDVLSAMGIEHLAPTGTMAFAADPRLRPASFRLPVYWLCIGKFPITFRAEILGLNLAMELSGVGGSYRAAQKFLRHYKFPTAFVDLHNTIDNVSTGHSAWAADALDAHLQVVAEVGDVEAEWLRVRTGYESLSPLVRRDSDLDYFPQSRPEPRSFPAELAAYHHATMAEQHDGISA